MEASVFCFMSSLYPLRELLSRDLCADSKQGDFFDFFFYVLYTTLLHLPPPTVSEDAEIEPRTVATSALAVRRSNH